MFCFTYLLLLFSHQVLSSSLWPHGLQYRRLPHSSLSPGVCSNSSPLSQWCHPAISASADPFSFCLQSSPASRSFSTSCLFTSRSQNIGPSASTSVLPMNIQDLFPLGLTGLISLLFKGLSRVFSDATFQRHQFFSAQSCLRTSLVAQMVKCLSTVRETWVRSLGQEDPLEKEMATHSSTIAWKIPWMEELVGYSPQDGKESDTTERLHFHFIQ